MSQSCARRDTIFKMTQLEKMLADAKECNKKLNVETTFKDFNKHPPAKPVPTKRTGIYQGDNWRNSKLTDKEVSDIRYFLDKGWCVTSTAKIVGVAKSTVRRYMK